jgi:plasmid stabilization system protein ParE
MRTSKNKDKPFILFFVMAFGLAWILMSLPVAQHYGLLAEELPLELLLIIGSWVPNIAAFIVIGFVIKRKGGIKNLLLGWTKWKMHPGWYFLAFSPVLFGFIVIGLYSMIYGYSPSTGLFTEPVEFLGLLVLITITGAMGEELGWRGFALPRLQSKMSALQKLDEIADYISLHNPAAAKKLVRKFFKRVDNLAHHPKSGKHMSVRESSDESIRDHHNQLHWYIF